MTAGHHTQVSRVLRVSHASGSGLLQKTNGEACDGGELRCHKVVYVSGLRRSLWLDHGHGVGIEGKMPQGSGFLILGGS